MTVVYHDQTSRALRPTSGFVIKRASCTEFQAMKDGIHPDYHEITVVMTDGTSYQTRSTYGKAGDTLRLDIDSKSHPAWTGGQQQLLDRGGRLSRFQKKFAGIGMKK
jgi:large subunit ribosomal protein L31